MDLDQQFVWFRRSSKKGVLESHYPVIFQQSNCFERYNGGNLAGKINKEFEEFRERSKQPMLSREDRLKIYGKCEIIKVKSGDLTRYVVNLYGQYGGGDCKDDDDDEDEDIKLDFEAERRKRFKSALEDFADKLRTTEYNDVKLAALGDRIVCPFKMGCGIGGGDWKDYSAIIWKFANKHKIFIQITCMTGRDFEDDPELFEKPKKLCNPEPYTSV